MQVIFTCTLIPFPLHLWKSIKAAFFKEQFCSYSFPLCTENKRWEFPVEARRPTSERPTTNTHHVRASDHRSPTQYKKLHLPPISVPQEPSFTFTEAGKAELKDRTCKSPQNQGIWKTPELSGDWTVHVPQRPISKYLVVKFCTWWSMCIWQPQYYL